MYYKVTGSLDPKTFLNPFSTLTWLAIFLNILLCSLGYFIITHLGDPHDMRHRYDYWLNTMMVMRGVLAQGTPEEPKKTSGRVIFFMVYLTSLILFSAYSAALTSHLAIPVQKHPFTDAETLLYDSRYNILTIRDTIYSDAFKVHYILDRQMRMFKGNKIITVWNRNRTNHLP